MCEMKNQSHIYANITWMNLIAAELIRVLTELEHLWLINKRKLKPVYMSINSVVINFISFINFNHCILSLS